MLFMADVGRGVLTAGCLYCRIGADMWVFDTVVCNIMGTFYYEGLRKWHVLRLRMRKKEFLYENVSSIMAAVRRGC